MIGCLRLSVHRRLGKRDETPPIGSLPRATLGDEEAEASSRKDAIMNLDRKNLNQQNFSRRQFAMLAGTLFSTGVVQSRVALGQENQFSEPVHRVANASSLEATPAAVHPLDRALDMARRGLHGCQNGVSDYTAMLIKRERVGGTLGDHEFMAVKVRNRKMSAGQMVQPMGVYINFLKPSSVKGREVIYVEGKNEGNLIAHEGGFKGRFLPTVTIPPTGMLAMRGQRYPMTEIGVENLMVKLIERGTKAREQPDVQCVFRKNARVKNRTCTVLQVTSPTKVEGLDFYQAQVFIDDELDLPIRYIAYDWPAQKGAPLEVIEEYNYLDLKVNVGLSDADFDPHNESYNFYS